LGQEVLKPETQRCEDRISLDPVGHVELMKPPAAESDLLGSRLDRIRKQGPYGRHAPPESADFVSRAAIRCHLLVIVAANTGREAKGQVLIERSLDMKVIAALTHTTFAHH